MTRRVELTLSICSSIALGLELAVPLVVFTPTSVALSSFGAIVCGVLCVRALGDDSFGYRWIVRLGTTGAVLGYVALHPPRQFMDHRVELLGPEATFREVLDAADFHAYRCERLLDERVRIPFGPVPTRRELAVLVEAQLPADFHLGMCGTGVSMLVAPHPISADFWCSP